MFGRTPHMHRAGIAFVVVSVVAPGATLSVIDTITPGSFVVEPPTLHCFGFQWFVEGDDNENARSIQPRNSSVDEHSPWCQKWGQGQSTNRLSFHLVQKSVGHLKGRVVWASP
jgi:hypothetical protein